MKYLISIVTTVVETSDDRPGIPQDIQSRMFEQSFTTKDVGKGTGLGPNISYLIVVEMRNVDRCTTKSNLPLDKSCTDYVKDQEACPVMAVANVKIFAIALR